MAGNRVFYILLLFTAAGIYIFTNTYYTLMLLGLVVLMPLISLALMLVSAKGISISAKVPASCEKQQESICSDRRQEKHQCGSEAHRRQSRPDYRGDTKDTDT